MTRAERVAFDALAADMPEVALRRRFRAALDAGDHPAAWRWATWIDAKGGDADAAAQLAWGGG